MFKTDGGNSLLSSVAVDLENATSSSCVDTRALDFSYQTADFPSGASKVCVTFTTLSQFSTPEELCIDIGKNYCHFPYTP